MGLLDGLLSPLVTAATGAAGDYENAEANAGATQRATLLQGIQLSRAARSQQITDAMHQAQTNDYMAQDQVRQAAAAKNDKVTALRVAMLRHSNPDFANYSDDELSGIASDPVTFENASGYGRPSGQFLRGIGPDGKPTYGYGNKSTGSVTPTDFGAPPPRTPANPSTATPQQHYTQTMHDFNAVDHQLNGAKHDLTTAQKPLPMLATSSDSAAKNATIAAALRRVQNLQPMDDSLSAAMRGDNSVPGHLPSSPPPPASRASSPAAQREYNIAAQALQAAGGPANAQARAKYDRIVQAITDKYSGQQP